MSAVLDESHRHVRKAASAAEGATASSTSLASATEELSASTADIGSQVAGASGIVEEATRRTDSAVAHTSVTTVKDIDQVAVLITAIQSGINGSFDQRSDKYQRARVNSRRFALAWAADGELKPGAVFGLLDA